MRIAQTENDMLSSSESDVTLEMWDGLCTFHRLSSFGREADIK